MESEMTKDKALQIVLYALELEDLAYRYEKEPAPKHIAKAITAVKEALAQPEQEPVAWMKIDNYLDDENLWCEQVTFNQNEDGKPLYTAPPAKPWVGLTDEEIAVIAAACGGLASDFVVDVARSIEQAHGITGESK